MALIENIQRQGLNPIEEAHAYQHLIDKFKVTQEKMSEVLGKARTTVANTLRLLKLPHEIQVDIKKGEFKLCPWQSFVRNRGCKSCAQISPGMRCQRAVCQRAGNSYQEPPVENAEEKNGAGRREPLVAVLEEQLQQILATKVRISKRKKRGHILIEFYSQEDLERIAGIFKGGQRA